MLFPEVNHVHAGIFAFIESKGAVRNIGVRLEIADGISEMDRIFIEDNAFYDGVVGGINI